MLVVPVEVLLTVIEDPLHTVRELTVKSATICDHNQPLPDKNIKIIARSNDLKNIVLKTDLNFAGKTGFILLAGISFLKSF